MSRIAVFSSHPKSVPVFKAFNNRLYGLGVSLTTVFRFRYTAIVCVSTRVSTSSTAKEKAKNKINWKPLEVNDSDWPSCETLQAPALRPIVERRRKKPVGFTDSFTLWRAGKQHKLRGHAQVV